MGHVEEEDVRELAQHGWVGEVQVHLVVAEGVPDMADSGVGVYGGDQRAGSWPHHGAGVGFLGQRDEVMPSRVAAADEVREPQALPRAVVDHQVEHGVVALRQGAHVLPVAQAMVHAPVVDDGEAVVRGRREERQHVQASERAADVALGELPQGLQGRPTARDHGVGIDNQHGVAASANGGCGRGPRQIEQFGRQAARGVRPVQQRELHGEPPLIAAPAIAARRIGAFGAQAGQLRLPPSA